MSECWRRDRHLLPVCPAPEPCPTQRALILALAEHLADASEVIGERAEKRVVVITETDFALE